MTNKMKLAFTKAIDAEKKSLTAMVSTYEWDRTGERFAQGAWDLKQYLKNPVVLWGHDPHEPPIARTVALRETDKGLEAEMVFDAGSERAMDIFRLYKEGFLNAFSVGFVPKNWRVEQIDGTQEKGIVFVDAELLEYSAVTIPANPGALISREQAELVTKALGPDAVKPVAEKEGFFMIPPQTEEPAAVHPPATPEALTTTADFEKSLRYIIDLAKIARQQPLEQSKLELIKNAMATLQEIADANRPEIDAETLQKLAEVVKSYANVIATMFPSLKEQIDRTVGQVARTVEQ
jgi:uncharacterized protein